MSAAAVSVRAARKAYRFFTLDDVSFEVASGQIMGLVGPNGAGKSTSIRLLMGLQRPDAGDITVLGRRMPDEQAQAKRDIGYVAADMRLYGMATLAWHMRFVASIYPGWDAAYAEQLLQRFNLHAEQMVKSLSQGEHMKAMLLLAFARRPRLLVLDEPTTGLDPVARHEVLAEVTDILRDEQRSVLFSSHNTLDVERVCDQITFIDRGRLVDSRDRESFLERWRRLQLQVPVGLQLPDVPGLVEARVDGHFATIVTQSFDPAIVARLEQAGAKLIELQRMSLEEIFVASVMQSRREIAS